MTSTAAKYMVNNEIQNLKNNLPGQKKGKGIEWSNFNYPPLIKVFHFTLKELDEDEYKDIKPFVRNLWISHLVFFVITLVNFINNCAQVAALGHDGLRIFYSILFLFVFNPVQCYWFYCGYKGSIDEKGLLFRFKILGVILTLLYITFSIANFGNWNGWIRMSEMFDAELAFPGILCLIESLLFTALFFFTPFYVYKSMKM